MLFGRRNLKLLLIAVLLLTPCLSSTADSLPSLSSQIARATLTTPENLSTDGSPFDVAVGGSYVVWTKILGEFCGPPGSVKSLHLTTRVENTLVSDCDISLANVVADYSYAYYADWMSDTVSRIPLGGGTPSTIATADGLVYHRALALDETYVFFGDDVGVKRVLLGGGSVTTLAPGYDSYELAVDDNYVYWTEWGLSVSDDAIRRVLKTGGVVQTIVPGASLEDPLAIAVDDSYVYWTEGDSGKVRRVAKSGGTILDLVPTQPGYQAYSIAVDHEYVYWIDSTSTPGTGRLRRVPKDGGTVDNLLVGLSGPRGANISANYVYWGDWGGVWRLQVGPFRVNLPMVMR